MSQIQPEVVRQIPWWRWVPIIGVVALAFLVCATIVFVEVEDDFVAGTLIGFLFVQILLASVWTTLAPVHLITRVVTGSVFVLFLCLCMYRCADRDGGGPDVAIPIVAAMLAQWIFFQIPLWYLRYTGWTLSTSASAPAVNRREDFQFGIRHMLIWTTIIAAFMGAARFLIPQLGLNPTAVRRRLSLACN